MTFPCQVKVSHNHPLHQSQNIQFETKHNLLINNNKVKQEEEIAAHKLLMNNSLGFFQSEKVGY